MNPNFFNPFGGQGNNPFNPFDPNFANNINQTIHNSMNPGQNQGGFNPFAQFAQPQGHQYPPGFIPGANVNVNNHYNIGNNFYPEDHQENYYQQQNYQQQQQQQNNAHRSQNQRAQPRNEPNRPDKELKKTKVESAKEAEIAKAEQNPNSGHYYKRIGNDFYKKGQYQKAIENYTKAIQIDDTETIFFSNRARAYKLLGDFKKAYEDAKIAVELDDKNIKGHFLCGQILAEMGKVEPGFDKLNKALSRMTKALTLCAGQGKQEFEKDVEKNISRVKKVIWLKNEDLKKQKKIEALSYMKKMINSDANLSEAERNQRIEEFSNAIGDPLSHHTLYEIPDHLCCKITMDLMENPVITESGITYEKAALFDHFKRNGNFDPVTRDEINPKNVYPNVNIKQAVEKFIRENPWAFESQYSDGYLDIKF